MRCNNIEMNRISAVVVSVLVVLLGGSALTA